MSEGRAFQVGRESLDNHVLRRLAAGRRSGAVLPRHRDRSPAPATDRYLFTAKYSDSLPPFLPNGLNLAASRPALTRTAPTPLRTGRGRRKPARPRADPSGFAAAAARCETGPSAPWRAWPVAGVRLHAPPTPQPNPRPPSAFPLPPLPSALPSPQPPHAAPRPVPGTGNGPIFFFIACCFFAVKYTDIVFLLSNILISGPLFWHPPPNPRMRARHDLALTGSTQHTH